MYITYPYIMLKEVLNPNLDAITIIRNVILLCIAGEGSDIFNMAKYLKHHVV